jgi:hypothetical protein
VEADEVQWGIWLELEEDALGRRVDGCSLESTRGGVFSCLRLTHRIGVMQRKTEGNGPSHQ